MSGISISVQLLSPSSEASTSNLIYGGSTLSSRSISARDLFSENTSPFISKIFTGVFLFAELAHHGVPGDPESGWASVVSCGFLDAFFKAFDVNVSRRVLAFARYHYGVLCCGIAILAYFAMHRGRIRNNVLFDLLEIGFPLCTDIDHSDDVGGEFKHVSDFDFHLG